MMRRKVCSAIFAVAVLSASAVAADRYEAEDAVVNASETPVVDFPEASGGKYVQMRDGSLKFFVTAPSEGFYTLTMRYSQTCDDQKQQFFAVNGAAAGKMIFALTGTYNGSECGPPVFVTEVVAGKVRFVAGENTVDITKEWGWVDIDYMEVSPYEETPFTLRTTLVTPNASENARKVYQFMRENFTRKVISGVMTGYDLADGLTIRTVPEMKHVFDASGEHPALLGLDFLMSTGKEYNDDIPNGEHGHFYKYTKGVLDLAEEIFNAGGIPHLMWHWRDPLKDTKGFYSTAADGNDWTSFDLGDVFVGGAWNTSSSIYDSLIADIDRVSGYLQTLADKDIPVLWRPLHEAAGGWFWWGRGKKPEPLKALWALMFERMVEHHGLNNLIWVWTCEEGGDAAAWYPGDEYVDMIGRDIYHWPNPYQLFPGSLVSNFENLKNTYDASKIIALSENGSVPHPDSIVQDGAWWSFFMSWNGQFTTGNANPSTHWQEVMGRNIVLSLEDMHAIVGTGWASYNVTSVGAQGQPPRSKAAASSRAPIVSVRGKTLNIAGVDNSDMSIRLVNVNGRTVARFNAQGRGQFSLAKVPAGRYIVETRVGGKRVGASAVVVK